jgi:hypothetical protein
VFALVDPWWTRAKKSGSCRFGRTSRCAGVLQVAGRGVAGRVQAGERDRVPCKTQNERTAAQDAERRKMDGELAKMRLPAAERMTGRDYAARYFAWYGATSEFRLHLHHAHMGRCGDRRSGQGPRRT